MDEVLTTQDFPGYAEAVAREGLIRAAACLGVMETICGVDVLPMTARHVRLLVMCNSPFMLKDIPAEKLCEKPGIENDCMAFLWIVSPQFRAGNKRAQKKFFQRIGKQGICKTKIITLVKEILCYVEEAYLDAPEPDNSSKSYYSFEISVVNSLHRSWGLPVDFWENHWLRCLIRRFTGKPCALDVPLKIVWQHMKEQRQFNNPEAVLSNISDRKLSDGLVAINERKRKEALN